MDNFLERVYLGEVRKQCGFALQAAAHVNDALAMLHDPESGRSACGEVAHGEVFRNLHSLLTHASNISRLLWPPNPLRKRGETNAEYKARKTSTRERGETLRQLLEIGGDHTLQGRTLRDHLEHFDERLDAWAATSEHRNIVQDYIGPHGGIGGLLDSDRMRAFDPESGNLTFRGETYHVQTLVTAIDELVPVVAQKEEELRYSPPDHRP